MSGVLAGRLARSLARAPSLGWDLCPIPKISDKFPVPATGFGSQRDHRPHPRETGKGDAALKFSVSNGSDSAGTRVVLLFGALARAAQLGT